MKRLLFITLALIIAAQAWAQNEDKFGPSTELFLQEMKQPRPFAPPRKMPRMKGVKPQGPEDYRVTPRMVSAPDTINGQVYMSAYLRVADSHNTGDVEALGVIIESRFSKGLTIALIPVDKIQDVAALPSVKHINAAAPKRKKTDMARQYTNTDDVLKHSADAITAGLGTAYDGTGVLLGVIDTGIDFNHIAFKDKNGNSRIVKAYVHNGSSGTEYNGSSIPSNLTDDNTEDHGTHTATTAGGSSVVTTTTTATVTDDLSAATYGGMAPGATLYLAGINGLNDTGLDNAVNKMVQYADANNMPLVVSNSWGSGIGPRDGTGDTADVYADLFGDEHPNRVALFAASNDAGNGRSENGGYHVRGTASSSSPLGTILRSKYYSNTDNGYLYDGLLAVAWTRASSSSTLYCKLHVLDSSTGAILWSSSAVSSGSISGFSTYYSGTITVQNISSYYNANGKKGLRVYVSSNSGVETQSATNYNSKYTLAIEVYPSSGSATIDMWGGDYSYFSNKLSTNGHTWVNGSDDMCVSDEATISDVISIGAYVSKNSYKNYQNSQKNYTSTYTMGDIAYFSSYATATESPTGLRYPWICAPGARLIAGVNHTHTTSVDDYSYYHSDNANDLVVNSSTSPYAAMEGTSMATPTAAGIVALWMQVAKENDIELTHSMIKEAMKQSAITDSYTTSGANASHFGNGKLDALAGIKYILDNYASTDPVINVAPSEVDFGEVVTGTTTTQTMRVSGRNLTGNVTLSLSAPNGGYTLSQSSITASAAADGVDVTLTFAPTALQSYPATLTITSSGATTVTVPITGTGALLKEVPVLNTPTTAQIGTTEFTASWSAVQNVQSYTLQVQKKATTSTVVDVLNNANTIGSSATNYSDWTATGADSKAGYSGNSAGGNDAIQLRAKDNSGIVVTSSPGKVKKIAVTWNSNTQNDRTIDIYGKTSAYSAPSDLYNSSNQGTKLGSIVAGTSTELTISDDYEYFGIRSNSGALYLDAINVTWEASGSASSPRKAISDIGDADSDTRTISGITATSHTVDNLTSGGKYTYKVKAVYTDNSEGEWSAAKDVTLASGPTIIAIDDELSVSATVGESGTATLGILCEALEAGVTATLGGTNANLFTITPASVTKAEAEEGAEFTITYTPTAAGTHTATVTLTSTNAESVVVPITGTATAAAIGKPEATPATAVTASGFTANWNPLTGADGYELHVYTTTSGGSGTSASIASNFTDKNLSVGSSELSWSASPTANSYESSGSARGVAWSSGAKPTLTASISGATSIDKVTVVASANSASAFSVSVDGDSYGSQSVAQGTSLGSFEFTGSSAGEISITVTQSSKSFWIKSITVDYTTGGGGSQNVEITGSPFAISSGSTTSYAVTGLEAETTYHYYVYGKQSGEVATEASNVIDVTTLSGVATPELVVDPATLTFTGITTGTSSSQTFNVLGADLTGAVSVAVTGDYFSVSPASILAADAEEGATVTVTYAPEAAGSHSGTVTLSSEGAESVTVALSGTAVAPAIGTPVATAATDVSASGFTANWDQLTGADGYELHVYTTTSGGSGTSETSTLTFTVACGGSGTADDGAAWTVTSDGTESTYDSTKGIHYGTGSADVQYIQLATSDISGTVSQVVVNASTASGVSATASVTVGGTSFTCGDETSPSLSATATSYTFTGSGSGEIVVRVEKPSSASKALYVKSVAVDYSTGGGSQNVEITGSPFAISGGSTTSKAITGLEAETTYYYYVYGKQGGTVATEQSNVINVTTSAGTPTPTITADPASVNIAATNVGQTATGTFTVTGSNLTGAVNVAITGDYLSVSPATIAAADAATGATVTVTYAPEATGSHSGTVTLTSEGAATVTVPVTASATMPVSDPVLLTATEAQIGTTQFTASWTDSTDDAYVDSYTLYINKKAETPAATSLLTWDGSDAFGSVSTDGTANIGSSLSNYDMEGWSGNYIYAAPNGIKFSSSNNAGNLTTPELDFSETEGTVTVKFNAMSYSNDNSSIVISTGNNSVTQALTGTAADYTVTLSYSAATSKTITFASTAKKKRFYLYSMEIVSGDATASSAPRLKAVSDNGNADDEGRTISGITAKSHTVDQLTAGSTYIYKVKAVYINGDESQWTEEKEVTLKAAATLGEAVGTSVINLPVNIAYVDENGIAYGCASAGENQITDGNATEYTEKDDYYSDRLDDYDQRDWVAIAGLDTPASFIGKTISGFEGEQDTTRPGYFYVASSQPTTVVAQSGDNNVPKNNTYQVRNLVAESGDYHYVRPQIYEYTTQFTAGLKKDGSGWVVFGNTDSDTETILVDTSLCTPTDADATADGIYRTLEGVFVAVAGASHAPLRSGSADLSTQSYQFRITKVSDVATGIETLKADGVEYKLRGIYNLQGQRVRETIPGHFYIINGEKRRVGHVIRDNDF